MKFLPTSYSPRKGVITLTAFVVALAGVKFAEAQFVSPTCVPPDCNPQVIQNIHPSETPQTADFHISGDGGIGSMLEVGTQAPVLGSATDNLFYGNVGGTSSAGSLLLLQFGGADRFKVGLLGNGVFADDLDVQGGDITNTTGALNISSADGTDLTLSAPGTGDVFLGAGDSLTIPGDLNVTGSISGDGSGLTELEEVDTFADVVARGNDSGGAITVSGDLSFDAADRSIRRGAEAILSMYAASTVVNESGVDQNFRVEGSGNPNALFVRGSNGFVGIGTGTPLSPLQVCNSSGVNCSYGLYGATGDWYIRPGNTTSGRILIADTGGSVGIGTNSVTGRLHVAQDSINDIIRLERETVGGVRTFIGNGGPYGGGGNLRDQMLSGTSFYSIEDSAGDDLLLLDFGGSTATIDGDLNVSGTITGANLGNISGTANQVAKFTSSSDLGDSIISDDGATVNVGGALTVGGTDVCLSNGTDCPPSGVSGTANYVPKFDASTDGVGNSVIYEDAGEIGIGTTSPNRTLTVNGDIGGDQVSGYNLSGSAIIGQGSYGVAGYGIAGAGIGGYFTGGSYGVYATVDDNSETAVYGYADGASSQKGIYGRATGLASTGGYFEATNADVNSRAVYAEAPSPAYAIWAAGNVRVTDSIAVTNDVTVGGDSVCLSTGTNCPSGGVSGTANYVPKFDGSADGVGNSLMYDNGSRIGIGTTSPSAGFLMHLEGGGIVINTPQANGVNVSTNFGSTEVAVWGKSLAGGTGVRGDGDTGVSGVVNQAGGTGVFASDGGQSGATALHAVGDSLMAGNVNVVGGGNLAVTVDSSSNADFRADRASTSNYASMQYRTAGTSRWAVGMRTTGEDLHVYEEDASTTRMFFEDGTGHVGIGTSSPSYQLVVEDDVHVGNSAASPGHITLNGNDMYVDGQFEAAGTAGSYIHDLALGSYNPTGNSGYIVTDGRVGIGTTSPTMKLDVSGNIKNTGEIYNYSTSGPQLNFEGDNADQYIRFWDYNAQWYAVGYDRSAGAFKVTAGSDLSGDDLVVSYGGNVGVSNANPTSQLHVGSNSYSSDVEARIESTRDAALVLEADTNNSGEYNNPYVAFSQDGGAVTGVIGYTPASNYCPDSYGCDYAQGNNLAIVNKYRYSEVDIFTGGYYGPRLITKFYQRPDNGTRELIHYGVAYKPGGGSWSASSDARIKKDVHDFESGLDAVKALRPVRYTYNGRGETEDGFEGIGFIAQEVQDVAPWMVGTRLAFLDDGDEKKQEILTVDPSTLPHLNLNAIKELDLRIEDFEAKLEIAEENAEKIERLEERVEELEGLILELEKRLNDR